MFGHGRPPPSPGHNSLPNAPSAEMLAARDELLATRDALAEEMSDERLGNQFNQPNSPYGGINPYSRSQSPNPFADGSFAAGLEVGGVNRL